MHEEEAYAIRHFNIFINLREEVEQISDFLVRTKILPL